MGRKKRKVVKEEETEEEVVAADQPSQSSDPKSSVPPPPPPSSSDAVKNAKAKQDGAAGSGEIAGAPASSHYAMTSHSAEIIEEDIYVSENSESEDEMDIVLVGSKSGLMRRGLHQQTQLVQPKRQWVRPGEDATAGGVEGGGADAAITAEEQAEKEEQQRLKEEEELNKLDPAERAARLLAEKQRKLEAAKEAARRLESEENAGRDPCLFSKRTAFDIRFDQIDEKPWTRAGGDLTDYFNYGYVNYICLSESLYC